MKITEERLRLFYITLKNMESISRRGRYWLNSLLKTMSQYLSSLSLKKNGTNGEKRILLKDEKEDSEVQTQSAELIENELQKTLLSTPEMINLKLMGKKLGVIQELNQTKPMTA